MKKTMLVAIVATMALFVVGAAPAGATTAGSAAAVLSPNLDDGFPCNGGGAGGFHAFQRFLTNTNVSYGPNCTGTIYSSGAGAVNSASTTGSGTHAGNNWNVAGANGAFSAAYTYSEPCQDVDGSGPVPPEAVTGEASGTLSASGPASGQYGTSLVTSGTTSTKFWWSRVGLTAVVGLRNLTVTLGTSTGTKVISEPNAVGLAAAVFIPTQSPNCAAPNHPGPNAIIIASPSLTAAA